MPTTALNWQSTPFYNQATAETPPLVQTLALLNFGMNCPYPKFQGLALK